MLDRVYKKAAVSTCLNSPRRMVRAGHNAKEILIPKISVTGLGNYTRNVGYKTGAITYEFETKTFNYDRGIRLFADVMDAESEGHDDPFKYILTGYENHMLYISPTCTCAMMPDGDEMEPLSMVMGELKECISCYRELLG